VNLRLPPTLASPREDEYPKTGYDVKAIDEARAAARIEPGYVLTIPTEPKPFTFYARCNLHTDQLWAAFEAFAACLPDDVGLLLGFKDEAPLRVAYRRRDETMPTLRLYRRELSCDPFLECGLIHQVDGRTEEVYIASAKYLRVWGNDLSLFRGTASALGLEEIPELRFVDQFPLTSHALSVVEPGALRFTDVLDDICERLGSRRASSPGSRRRAPSNDSRRGRSSRRSRARAT
jgi:hypothetical protein